MPYSDRRLLVGIAYLVAAVFAAAGCGGSSGGSSAQYKSATFTEFTAPGAGNDPNSNPGGVWPDDVAGDANGNIWFAEHHSNEIGRISPSGVYTGFPVPSPAGLMDGITIDSVRKLVYVTETANNKIARLDMTTGAVTEITMPQPNSVPGDLVHTADGTIYLTEGYEGGIGVSKIARLNPDTLQITEFTPTIPRNGADDLVLMPNGDLWYVEYADNRICKLSNGVFTEVVMPRPNVVPTNIGVDSHLKLWVTEQAGNAIAQYDPTTGAWREISIPTPNAQPSGICVDRHDNVWFTEYNGSKIGLIPAGSSQSFDYAIPTPNSGPEDIEVAPNGAIVFTEQLGNKVGTISVAGVTP